MSKSSHPDQFFLVQINSLQHPYGDHRLIRELLCGSFVGIFSGPAFALRKDAKHLVSISKPLLDYNSGRPFRHLPKSDDA